MADKYSIYCPKCHQKTSLTPRAHYKKPGSYAHYEIAECNSCNFFVLVKRSPNNNIEKIYPDPLLKPVHEKTPELLKKDLEEANLCFSVGAYRAAGVMARRVLQICCIDKKAPIDKKLQEQIDWLLKQQIITKGLKEWAHEVRLTGNDAAHPQKDIEKNNEIVSQDDAKDILTLLEKFIDVLYIAPALAEERRQKRQ